MKVVVQTYTLLLFIVATCASASYLRNDNYSRVLKSSSDVLLEESFEDGWGQFKKSTHNAAALITDKGKTDLFSVRMKGQSDNAVVETKWISVEDYTSPGSKVKLSFWYLAVGKTESFHIQYKSPKSTNWIDLDQLSPSDLIFSKWTEYSTEVISSEDEPIKNKIKFRFSNIGSKQDKLFIDDVTVKGEIMSVNAPVIEPTDPTVDVPTEASESYAPVVAPTEATMHYAPVVAQTEGTEMLVQGRNRQPQGFLDSAKADMIKGWTCDNDEPLTSIDVELYFGGPKGSGSYTVTVTASDESEGAVKQKCGGGDNHRFNVVPTEAMITAIMEGDMHVYAYGLDPLGNTYKGLSRSPKSYNNYATEGFLDSVTDGLIKGWACDKDTPLESIGVHLYFGGPAGSGSHTVEIIAGDTSENAVSKKCDGGDNHRFNVVMDDVMKNAMEDGDGKVYSYGLDTYGDENRNKQLNRSPKSV